jgi:hypothetical protein
MQEKRAAMTSGISRCTSWIVQQRGRCFSSILILAYAALTAFGALHHEPWRDEAQAWLIARDLSLPDIFHQMGHEGSPALWHIILLPFAKLGAPYACEFVIHWMLAVAAVATFAVFCPFPKIIKIFFVFSYYMACEYSIVARSYVLTVLLLFLIAAQYGSRFRRPFVFSAFIFLLFNTNIHSLFAAGALLVLYLYEVISNRDRRSNPRYYGAVLIMTIGGLTAIMQSIPPPGTFYYNVERMRMAPFRAAANAFLPGSASCDAPYFIFWDPFLTPKETNAAIFLACGMILVALLYCLRRPPALVFLLLSYSWLGYIFVAKNHGVLRHHGFIMIFIVFALWLASHYQDGPWMRQTAARAKWARAFFGFFGALTWTGLALSQLASIFMTYRTYKYEYQYCFSGAKEMAAYMHNSGYDKSTVIVYRAECAAALLPYLPDAKFWYPPLCDYGTFIFWKDTRQIRGQRLDQTVERVKQFFPDLSHVLFLLSNSGQDDRLQRTFRLELIHKTDGLVLQKDEAFALYRATGAPPSAGRSD